MWSGNYLDMDIQAPLDGAVRIYDLSVRLENGMARHPHHPPYAFSMAKTHGGFGYKNGVSAAMEMVAMGAHVGTHVDAFGHVAVHGEVYGERSVAMGVEGAEGLDVASVEETPPLIGQGHLVNMPKLLGRALTPADGIGPEHFEKWFAGRPMPKEGSTVLIRTGWMQYWEDPERYIGLATGLPGVTLEGAKWLSERGILATGSDTMNYEHKPDSKIINLPVHIHNLVENGIPIIEMLNLEGLAAADVNTFTFIAVPLRIAGGTGSPIRPIAIASRPENS